jgi:hypothetical protein
MKYLITCMGNSDPIREQHDSAILHICRHERPEAIIVIHSERSKSRHSLLERALESIPDYHYTLESWPAVIPNETVPLFDKVYDFINREVQKIKKDKRFTTQDEIILNITSGTPQMISALAVINRLEEYGFRAIQVTTPLEDSNIGSGSEKKSIEELIAENMDATVGQKNRCHEDLGENVRRLILANNLKKIIQNYDYKAAALLLEDFPTFPNGDRLLRHLNQAYESIQFQRLPEPLMKLGRKPHVQLAIFGVALLNMKWQRGELAEVLIRSKSIVEYVMLNHLRQSKSSYIVEYSTKNGVREKFSDEAALHTSNRDSDRRDINWKSLQEVFLHVIEEDYDSKTFLAYKRWIDQVDKTNNMRNNVAHKLEAITKDQDFEANRTLIQKALEATNQLVLKHFNIDEIFLRYYEGFNQSLLKLLP